MKFFWHRKCSIHWSKWKCHFDESSTLSWKLSFLKVIILTRLSSLIVQESVKCQCFVRPVTTIASKLVSFSACENRNNSIKNNGASTTTTINSANVKKIPLSETNMYVFLFKVYSSLCLGVRLTISQYAAPSHRLVQWWTSSVRINASLGLHELIQYHRI